MRQGIRFIHAADLHLGSMLHCSGDLSPYLQQLMRDASYNAFAAICQAAVEHEVDFLLLAGDLFEDSGPSVYANNFFNQQCQLLQQEEIPVFAVSGNHDPADIAFQPLGRPENLHLFSWHEVEDFIFKQAEGGRVVRLIGQSYRAAAEARKLHTFFQVPDDGAYNIGILHTQLDLNNHRYLPCSQSELMQISGVDYWALGHQHHCQVIREDPPVIAYPGIPQGRNRNEEGVGGSLLVELDATGETSISFLPTSSLVWIKREVWIDGADKQVPQNLDQLEELLVREAEELITSPLPWPEEGLSITANQCVSIEGFLVQWIIRGRGEIHSLLQEEREEAAQLLATNLRQRFGALSPALWTDSVIFRTAAPLPSLGELREENQVFATLDGLVQEIINDQDLQDELKSYLGAIWLNKEDHEEIDDLKFQLNDELLEAVISQASELIIEELLEVREH